MGNISFGTGNARFHFSEDTGILTGIETAFGMFAANSRL